MKACLLTGLLTVMMAMPGFAADSGPGASGRKSGGQAEIPFANLGGIYDWAADGDRGIYIQSINRQWYYAKLFAPCINLPFAERVGFVAEPGSGAFDRFSSIIVRGMECPVQSLTKSGPPPAKDKLWRSRQNTHQASRGSDTSR
jgi:hypothetical protein